mmetsp:Transcript_27413/g.59973  ORF Transcript_27413/g.59973 Transcript_27413/m.59973 type:complete len:207 (-) Transcript_27413:153-773(-)
MDGDVCRVCVDHQHRHREPLYCRQRHAAQYRGALQGGGGEGSRGHDHHVGVNQPHILVHGADELGVLSLQDQHLLLCVHQGARHLLVVLPQQHVALLHVQLASHHSHQVNHIAPGLDHLQRGVHSHKGYVVAGDKDHHDSRLWMAQSTRTCTVLLLPAISGAAAALPTRHAAACQACPMPASAIHEPPPRRRKWLEGLRSGAVGWG